MRYDALDQSIFASARAERENPITDVDRLAFMTALGKLAEEQPQPDTSGAIEGPFLVPLEQVVQLIAQMVSNEFKTQAYYVYYANMLRGLSREGIAEEFLDHAQDELEHANYLLRRMGVLSPGGVPIPAYPPPEPLADPDQIVQTMIVVEQMGLALWKQLLAVMGDNPMRYTIEEFLQKEEHHQDELWQFVQAPTPGTPPVEQQPTEQAPSEQPTEQQPEGSKTKIQVETSPKMASIVLAAMNRKMAADPNFKKSASMLITEKAMALRQQADAQARKEQVRKETEMKTPEQLNKLAPFVIKSKDNTAKPKDVSIVPASATNLVAKLSSHIKKSFGVPEIPPEEYIAQEEQLGQQQAMAEAAHARTIAMQASQAAQQAQAEATAAQQQLQETQAQLEQAQAEAQQNSVQALQTTQQAAEAESRAADHSIAKMQLGMRINQMRQELANLVMQDPVAESAANVSDLAAQGQPATPQQQADAEAAAQQQALTGEAPQPAAGAQEQQGASGGQEDPSQQQGGADSSAEPKDDKGGGGGGGGGEGKPGTHVTVKTSSAADVARSAGSAMAEGAINHVRDRSAKALSEHGGKLLAGVGTAGVLAGLKGRHDREQRREDMTSAVHEGMHRAMKTSALADRRLARAVMEGPKDELGNALRSIIHKGMPGEGAQAALGAKVKELGHAGAESDLPALFNKMKPHAPAFLGGMGVGVLAHKAMSGSRTPAASANYYDQYYER